MLSIGHGPQAFRGKGVGVAIVIGKATTAAASVRVGRMAKLSSNDTAVTPTRTDEKRLPSRPL